MDGLVRRWRLPEAKAQAAWSLPSEAFQHRIGYSKAAELAGVPKALFVKMPGERHVSPADYDQDELAQEFAAADALLPHSTSRL